jgi:hypothetical protein
MVTAGYAMGPEDPLPSGNGVPARRRSRARPRLTPTPIGWLLVGVVLVVIAAWAGIRFFDSFANLVRHGHFVADDLEAEMLANRDNPQYYDEYAAGAKISVLSVYAAFSDPNPTDNPPQPYFWASVTVANGSDRDHAVVLPVLQLKASYTNADGSTTAPTTIVLGCRPAGERGNIVPAHRTATLSFMDCDQPRSANAMVLDRPALPLVVTIDGRPLHGGPPNTPCYVAGCPQVGQSPPALPLDPLAADSG